AARRLARRCRRRGAVAIQRRAIPRRGDRRLAHHAARRADDDHAPALGHRARASAAQEAALRLAGEAVWTEERLKQFVRARFGQQPLYIVTNRQPVSHVRRGGAIHAQIPASGVVTALEPVARACGAVWLAHGSGDADRQATDAHDHVRLPADDPRYTLRRLWLTQAEEDGYYYGFANE